MYRTGSSDQKSKTTQSTPSSNSACIAYAKSPNRLNVNLVILWQLLQISGWLEREDENNVMIDESPESENVLWARSVSKQIKV